jgi:serine/threonine-protein kinase
MGLESVISWPTGNNVEMSARSEIEVIDERYVLDGLIGRGGMAEVRRAEDRRLGRSVAVKLLRETLASQAEARLRFEEEARAAARLTDPNVVAIYDTGEHNGRPFIVMELLPGRTLRDELDDGPLSEHRAREVIVHVLRALRAAHSGGVIHRDIKPANILLTEAGAAKVADFGIAKVAESPDLTATGLLLGTPSYLAPECVTGGAATAASDLYAAGVVFYEALSGRRPFAGTTPLAICHAIVSEDPPPLRELCPRVNVGLIDVVTRAMERDPRSRYRSADEMIRAVEDGAVPVPASVDETTEPIVAEPTLVSAVLPTEAVALPVALAAAEATQVFDRLGVRGPRAGWRAGVVALIVGIVALLGVAVLLAVGDRGGNPSTHPPVVTTGPVRVRPTTPSTVPTTASTARKQKPGHGQGKGEHDEG